MTLVMNSAALTSRSRILGLWGCVCGGGVSLGKLTFEEEVGLRRGRLSAPEWEGGDNTERL